MGDVIPPLIHFVWVGGKIPLRQKNCVLAWAGQNPTYRVHLWTNRNMVHVNGDELETAVNSYPGMFGDFSRDYWLELARTRINFRNKPLNKEVEVVVHSIDDLDATLRDWNLSDRLGAELHEQNYGGASDILRIAILQSNGGIYLDTDSDPLLALPSQLAADDGILFGILEKRGFCNAVIAAPRGHSYLTEIANQMKGEYDFWQRKNYLEKFQKGVTAARAIKEKAEEEAIRQGPFLKALMTRPFVKSVHRP